MTLAHSLKLWKDSVFGGSGNAPLIHFDTVPWPKNAPCSGV